MIPSLPSWWDAAQTEASRTLPEAPTRERLENPLSILPRSFEWTADLDAWSKIDYEKPMSGLEMRMLQRACIIRGETQANHLKRRQRYSVLTDELRTRGFEIPTSLDIILTRDDLYDRFRFPDQSFTLPDAAVPLPEDERFAQFLVLSDAQGCNFTHLLLAPDGDHAVTRSCHPYGLDDADRHTRNESQRQVFLLADSWDAFLCQAVDEITRSENEIAQQWLIHGDQCREAEQMDDAKFAYRLGLAYNPDSNELRHDSVLKEIDTSSRPFDCQLSLRSGYCIDQFERWTRENRR